MIKIGPEFDFAAEFKRRRLSHPARCEQELTPYQGLMHQLLIDAGEERVVLGNIPVVEFRNPFHDRRELYLYPRLLNNEQNSRPHSFLNTEFKGEFGVQPFLIGRGLITEGGSGRLYLATEDISSLNGFSDGETLVYENLVDYKGFMARYNIALILDRDETIELNALSQVQIDGMLTKRVLEEEFSISRIGSYFAELRHLSRQHGLTTYQEMRFMALMRSGFTAIDPAEKFNPVRLIDQLVQENS